MGPIEIGLMLPTVLVVWALVSRVVLRTTGRALLLQQELRHKVPRPRKKSRMPLPTWKQRRQKV